MSQPSVGRIVHYVARGSADGQFPSTCRAAIIADVYSEQRPPRDPECVPGVETAEWVALVVLNPTGVFFNDVCRDELSKQGGTWHWPERVE